MTSSTPPLARKAAKVLSQPRDAPKGESDEARLETVSAIKAALRDRAKRRRRMRWLVPTCTTAAAAAILVTVGWSAMHPTPAVECRTSTTPPTSGDTVVAAPALKAERVHGSVFVMAQGSRRPLTEGSRAELGQAIAVTDGNATLVLASGTRLEVEGKSDLSVTEEGNTHIVHLSSGAVTATVAKVAPGSRFVVRTEEADVEVRGTIFASNGVTGRAAESRRALLLPRDASPSKRLPRTVNSCPVRVGRAAYRRRSLPQHLKAPVSRAIGSIGRRAPPSFRHFHR